MEPQYTESELATLDKTTPSVTGQSVGDARAAIASAGLNCRVIGTGGTVERQVPSAGKSISESGMVVLYTGAEEADMVEVPDFTGMSVSQANEAAGNRGLNIKFAGNSLTQTGAVAYSQDYAAGTSVEIGTIITVSFRLENGSD